MNQRKEKTPREAFAERIQLRARRIARELADLQRDVAVWNTNHAGDEPFCPSADEDPQTLLIDRLRADAATLNRVVREELKA